MYRPPDGLLEADALALAPHPDDIELGCGGTLLRLVASGFKVGLVDLTRGERGTRGSAEVRALEARSAAEILGAAFRVNLGLPDLGVDSRSPDQRRLVVETLRRARPRLVLTCSEQDRHPDHVETARLVDAAAYLAGLRGFQAGGGIHRPGRVAYFMGRTVFEPRLIVDISEVFEKKLQAVSAHRSQFFREPGDPLVTPISEPDFLERVRARNRFFGSRAGVAYGEPFDLREPFGLSSVGDLLGQPSPPHAGEAAP